MQISVRVSTDELRHKFGRFVRLNTNLFALIFGRSINFLQLLGVQIDHLIKTQCLVTVTRYPPRRPKSWHGLATAIASHTYFSLLVSEKTRQHFQAILQCVVSVTNPKFHSDYCFQEQRKAPGCTCF